MALRNVRMRTLREEAGVAAAEDGEIVTEEMGWIRKER